MYRLCHAISPHTWSLTLQEGVLFRQVFSDGATPSSLLAADVLTFIARLVHAGKQWELCYCVCSYMYI